MQDVAAHAVRPQPMPMNWQPEVTPSLSAILRELQTNGNGDREMLLALLRAKQAEDEVRD